MLFQVKPPKGVSLANLNFDDIPANYFTDFIISKKDVEILKQQARQIKREKKISHHTALDMVAKKFKFHHWKHMLIWREKSLEIEHAFHKGCIVAFDSMEDVDLDDCSLIEIERETLIYLFKHELKILYGSQVDEDDESGRFLSETLSDSELERCIQEDIDNMDFYRIAPNVRYRSLKQAVKVIQDRCFWLPNMIRYRGRMIDTYTLPSTDAKGEIIGFRY